MFIYVSSHITLGRDAYYLVKNPTSEISVIWVWRFVSIDYLCAFTTIRMAGTNRTTSSRSSFPVVCFMVDTTDPA